MPMDGKGRFHLNSQMASGRDKMEAPTGGEESMAPGGVPEHLKAMHAEMGGKHMHVHHDGIMHTSHQIGEDGEVEGPHDHENIEELKSHLGKFFDEEEGEGKEGEGGEEPEENQSLY